MVRLWDAIVAEQKARDALLNRINQGIAPEDSKVDVLRLVSAHGTAVQRRALIEARDRIIERIPA